MLSEEEKKAIERVEDTFYENKGKGINNFQKITLYEDGILDILKLLNIIEKLQKENELAKEQLKKQCEIADERNNLLVKVNRLESQIDLMANYIVNLIKYNNPEEIREVEELKQYFERKSEK